MQKKKANRFIAILLSLMMTISLMPTTSLTAQAASRPKLANKKITMKVGESKKIKIKNKPKKAKVTYKSRNKKIAKVTKKGEVKGRKKGITKIRVTIKAKNKKYVLQCKVIVKTEKEPTKKPTPTLTPTPKPTPTLTPTPKPTPTLTLTPKPTPTLTLTPKPTPTLTLTPKPTPTLTPTLKPTPTLTLTPKPTPTLTPKPTPTLTPTPKPTPTLTPKPTPTPTTYTVTFDSNGGSAVVSQDVKENEMAIQPTDPTKEGYTFGGWYTDANCTNAFNFTVTAIKANITLYAKWTISTVIGDDPQYTSDPVPSAPVSYTIIFESNGGNAINRQTVIEGDSVKKPTDPIKEGYTFDGWYSDSELKEEYDFESVVTQNMILYAKWNVLLKLPDSVTLPVQKVLVISFDPIFPMADNKYMHDLNDDSWLQWNDPHDLSKQYIAAMEECSHGNAKYEIADWITIDDLPQDTYGQKYTREDYYQTLQNSRIQWDYWDYAGWKSFGEFDYDYYLSSYNVYERVEKGEINEVWFFCGPCIGPTIYETVMVGRGAYFCNGTAFKRNDCPAFVCYGFNYEREVGCMLEDAGHRFEFIMNHKFGRDISKPLSEMNDWELFTLYNDISGGNAACGNVHFAPNSTKDYDWGNWTKVYSTWEDWAYNYPDLTGEKKLVDASSWGNGDMAAHHKWWFSCIPHVDGVNEKNASYNNWWIYFIYPVTAPWEES